MIRRVAMALLMALPVVALAARDGRPDWTSGESIDYPKALYLLGVGVADDRQTAEDRARAEIARTFSSHVVATTSSFAQETGRNVDGVTITARDTAISDSARTATQKELVGVEVGAVWQDPETKQVYALAALDRRKAAERLEDQLGRIDAECRRIGAAFARAARLEAGVAALRYRALSKRRDPLVADLRVVSGKAPESGMASLDAAAGAALKALVVSVSSKNDPAGVIATGVIRGLAGAGMLGRTDTDPAAADLRVDVETWAEDLGAKDRWYWARATTRVVVREVPTGRVLLQLQDAERQGATVQGEALGRALRALGSRLETRLPKDLASALEGAPH